MREYRHLVISMVIALIFGIIALSLYSDKTTGVTSLGEYGESETYVDNVKLGEGPKILLTDNLPCNGLTVCVDLSGIPRTATYVIAASDSTSQSKAQADYVCDGTDDHVEIQAAIDALPTTGGRIVLDEGTYDIGASLDFDGNSDFSYEHVEFVCHGTLQTDDAISLIRVGNTYQVEGLNLSVAYLKKTGVQREAGSKGIELIRSVSCRYKFDLIDGFDYGIHVNGISGPDANGLNMIGHNDFAKGDVWMCNYGLALVGDGLPVSNNAELNNFNHLALLNSFIEGLNIGAHSPHNFFYNLEVSGAISESPASAKGIVCNSKYQYFHIFALDIPNPALRLSGTGVISSHFVVQDADTEMDRQPMSIIDTGRNILLPTNGGWMGSFVGSGDGLQWPGFLRVNTGYTASSRGLYWTELWGLTGSPGASYKINWSKKLIVEFEYERANGDTETVSRVQLKSAFTEGAMTAPGIGIRADNYNLMGESYGSSLGTVDLNTILADNTTVNVVIVCYLGIGAPRIEWYVDCVLKGTQSTVEYIPTGITNAYFVHSIVNGATGGADCYAHVIQPRIRQEP